MDDQCVPLAELLAVVAEEMRTADVKARLGGEPVMKFKECELEFGLNVEANARGEIKLWVFKLGGGAKTTESNKIKIKYERLEGAPVVADVMGPAGAVPAPVRQKRKKR